jgi:hypothetical protein
MEDEDFADRPFISLNDTELIYEPQPLSDSDSSVSSSDSNRTQLSLPDTDEDENRSDECGQISSNGTDQFQSDLNQNATTPKQTLSVSIQPWGISGENEDRSVSEQSNRSIATSSTARMSRTTRPEGLMFVQYEFLRRKMGVQIYQNSRHLEDHAPHLLPRNEKLHPDTATRSIISRRPNVTRPKIMEGQTSPLPSFLPTLFNPPDEAFDENGYLRRLWMYEERPQLFTEEGTLQMYVQNQGKPPAISWTLWEWLGAKLPPATAEGRIWRRPESGLDRETLIIVDATYRYLTAKLTDDFKVDDEAMYGVVNRLTEENGMSDSFVVYNDAVVGLSYTDTFIDTKELKVRMIWPAEDKRG